LDKPLHVMYKVSKLAYRIWVILIDNERVKQSRLSYHVLASVELSEQESDEYSTLTYIQPMAFQRCLELPCDDLRYSLAAPPHPLCRLVFSTSLQTCIKKVKLSLCLTNQALRHESVWGSGCVYPRFLYVGTSWRWVVSFTPLPHYKRLYPLDRRLGGPQSRSQSLYRLRYRCSSIMYEVNKKYSGMLVITYWVFLNWTNQREAL
jgi:hypothetical protein